MQTESWKRTAGTRTKYCQDYLALEKMRFEERLNIEMALMKPPWSSPFHPDVTTLVENAINMVSVKRLTGPHPGVIRFC